MASTAGPIKNVVVMIADGAGFNTLEATRLYLQGLANGDPRAGAAGKVLIADGRSFTATAQSVFPLDNRTAPLPDEAGLAQNPAVVYDPAKIYDFTPVSGLDPNGQPRAFAGYEFNRNTLSGLRQHRDFHRHRRQDLQQRHRCRWSRRAPILHRRACEAARQGHRRGDHGPVQ